MERYETDTVNSPDVALELPTGTGKTLIGLLIAEWRRRKQGERVLYLCPTRQLAHQVGVQARRYGIDLEVCLRPNYSGLTRWNNGDAIAVSTYAALFNYNPRFTAPQTLVLDDAHAAENYVADHWTVSIDRSDMPTGYRELTDLLSAKIDPRLLSHMREEVDPVDRTAVDVIPLPHWWDLSESVREIVERAVDGTDEWYAWRDHVSDGLGACSLFVSWRNIVLRPLVPTTKRQSQFADANQRVYMSATLGSGGELERIFGVRQIARLPVPQEWEEHSTGRRIFLFPSASLPADELDQVVVKSVEKAGRTLVLAPTSEAVRKRGESFDEAEIETLGARDVEESLDAFTGMDSGALILANRYDGIDLPQDDCRLVILDGLPIAVNQLERFLYRRLAATGLLGERMRTRLTQGVGRATRGEGDWCAVIVGSGDAYEFCSRGEMRQLLHPELQAELRFGLEQSVDRTANDFLGLLEVLLEHGEGWLAADDEVRELRESMVRGTDPAAEALQAAVGKEVDFSYAMWDADYPRAVTLATEVVDALSGDPVAPYRAWWNYQAGAAAWMAHTAFGVDGMGDVARDHFRRAVATGRTVHWFAELAYGDLGIEPGEVEVSSTDLEAAERLQRHLRSIGLVGPKFRERVQIMESGLSGTDSTSWEEALTQLGRELGFDSSHPGGQNDPDSVWVASKSLAIAWEVKSEESPAGEIGARTVQQAMGHGSWVREHCSLADDAEVVAILVSDRAQLGDGANVHVGDASIVSLDEVRSVSSHAVACLRRLRSLGSGLDEPGLRDLIVEEFDREKLLASALVAAFTSRRLAELAR